MTRSTRARAHNRIFSMDSAKAVKANAYGYLNAIHYMAPYDVAGVGNLCPMSSAGCRALCLGLWSGQAGMVKDQTDVTTQGNSVRASRIQKAQRFMTDRAGYLLDFVRAIDNARIRARRQRRKLCVRPNGATDVAYEGIRFTIVRNAQGKAMSVTLGGPRCPQHFRALPGDSIRRLYQNCAPIPPRIACQLFPHTVSIRGQRIRLCHSSPQWPQRCRFVRTKPTVAGFQVIDGDKHDLRHLDPKGCVVGLSPKGLKAKRDTSGFVLRDYQEVSAPLALAA